MSPRAETEDVVKLKEINVRLIILKEVGSLNEAQDQFRLISWSCLLLLIAAH